MEMSLMHAGLAAGAALAALPVILHLFMRQTPKHIIFPALWLLRERQKQSKKRMRIKNWLLLLARMAILALMALALARPRVYSEVPLGDESQPMALGPGLRYQPVDGIQGQRQDAARRSQGAGQGDHRQDCPIRAWCSSSIRASRACRSGWSPAAALKRIDGLAIRAVNRPLNAAMGQVYPAVAECERPVHVVYVLTDSRRTAWHAGQPAEGLDAGRQGAKRAKARRSPRSSGG